MAKTSHAKISRRVRIELERVLEYMVLDYPYSSPDGERRLRQLLGVSDEWKPGDENNLSELGG